MVRDEMRVGVAGCLGYTGFELVKLLDRHPNTTLEVLTARVPDNVKKDPRFSSLLKEGIDPKISTLEDADFSACELVFFATPHGVCMEYAKKLFNEKMNGLAQNWVADSVFMNHPYSNSKEWIPYAVSQYKLGHAKELVLLIKMDVSTKWWRSISTYPFLAVNKRLKFGDGKGAAPFQSAIVYLGDRLGKFRRIFGKYGTLYMPVI